MKLKNVVKHFILITKHRWIVFKLCCKLHEPWRGLVHDLSKYSPTEFWEGVKYYQGTYSPIVECKKANGYSKAWLHHKGRNKHHAEYWVDEWAPDNTPIIPYKYVAEMICDKVAAGIAYSKGNWTNDLELNYYLKERNKIKINKKIDNLLIEFLTKLSKEGIENTFKKQYVKELYKKHCG